MEASSPAVFKGPFRYKAFISYSHAADGRLAPALQHAVQVFTKPWYALRACRVFRDDTTLSVTSALWPSIEKALLDAEFFVLLASPAAAGSEWVSRELQRWCDVRETGRILIVLTDGAIAWDNQSGDFDWTTTTALPRSLERTFAEQPLYLDLRWARTADHLSRRQPQFLEAVADLSCSLRGLSKDELLGMEVHQHRRTRRIVIGAVTTLLALTIAAVVASVLLSRALKVAEERRVQARGVAETIVYEVQDSLAGVPEAIEAKKRLTAKAEALVLALGSARSDLRLKRAQLVQHSQKADEAVAAGRLDLARAELTKSLALAKDLAAHDAMNSALRRDVSVCLNKLGKLLLGSGDPQGALLYFEQELAIAQELAIRSPGDLRSRNDMAMAQENLGKTFLALGKLAEAGAVLEKDVTLMRELHAGYPTNDDVTHGLAVALVAHSEVLMATRNHAGATANLREALVLDTQVQTARPSDARISHAMSIAHLKLGDLAVADRDFKGAETEFEQSLRLRRALLLRSPGDLAAQEDVAVVLARLGSLLIHEEQDEAGVAYMNEAIEMENALLAAAPADEPLRRDLAVNLYDLSEALLGADRFADAQRHLTRSIELLRGISPQSSAVHPLGLELINSLRRGGRVELQLENGQQAARLHREACKRIEDIPDGALGTGEATSLVYDLRDIAAAHLDSPLGDREMAVACAREGARRLEWIRSHDASAMSDADTRKLLEDLQRLTRPVNGNLPTR